MLLYSKRRREVEMENSSRLIPVPRQPPRAAQAGGVNPAGLPSSTTMPAPYPNPSPPIVSTTVQPQLRDPVPATVERGALAAGPHLLPVADVGQIRSHADEIAKRGADLPANKQQEMK
jgi:hypothetical protein